MALVFTAPLVVDASRLIGSQTMITLDSSYVAGGIPLTPQQLGFPNRVIFGTVCVRTPVATHSPGEGALDCTNPAAPKLKLIGETSLAELGAGQGSGAVLDVTAWGN